MTSILRLFILSTVITGAAFSQDDRPVSVIPADVLDPGVTCKEAARNAGKIKAGMTETDVRSIIGDPVSVEKGVWIYDFWACLPPIKPGSQSIIGLALTFKDGSVSKIDYATVCATGPGGSK